MGVIKQIFLEASNQILRLLIIVQHFFGLLK